MNWTLKNENIISPVNKHILTISGIYLILILFLCVILNALLLSIYYKHKQIRTSLNQIIMLMTLFNLIGSIQFPFIIDSFFVTKYNKFN
jgi:Na+-driven multidrug efflux pump